MYVCTKKNRCKESSVRELGSIFFTVYDRATHTHTRTLVLLNRFIYLFECRKDIKRLFMQFLAITMLCALLLSFSYFKYYFTQFPVHLAFSLHTHGRRALFGKRQLHIEQLNFKMKYISEICSVKHDQSHFISVLNFSVIQLRNLLKIQQSLINVRATLSECNCIAVSDVQISEKVQLLHDQTLGYFKHPHEGFKFD